MRPQNATAPGRPARGGGDNRALGTRSNHSTRRLPTNWRKRLPQPITYYEAFVADLSPCSDTKTAVGRCPFHDPCAETGTFHVDLSGAKGRWRCSAGCGSGDLVTFAQRRHALAFPEAVWELLRFARQRADLQKPEEHRRHILRRCAAELANDAPMCGQEHAKFARAVAERRARDEGVLR